jgi:hypothetical protein
MAKPGTYGTFWRVLLVLAWAVLGVRVVVGFVHRESFQNDAPTLELLGFVILSAVLGSRVWLAASNRLVARHTTH